MPTFFTHEGCSALSASRRRALVEPGTRLSDAGIVDISARYEHYVALDSNLDNVAQNLLERLLTYQDVPEAISRDHLDEASNIVRYYVYPRFGTITPWSSKATSIAHVCGLRSWRGSSLISRIERGVVYTLVLANGAKRDLPQDVLQSLYDRMTDKISMAPLIWFLCLLNMNQKS